jgi:hypothetical protein
VSSIEPQAPEGTRAARFAAALFALVAAALLSSPARAVPIPWLNCGAPGDLLAITQSDASAWPPTIPAPARATAIFDATGHLANLHLVLVHGVSWAFDSGPLPATASAGFVSLPASFPMTVTGPALPLAAGPYVTTRTFTGSPGSVTILSKANVAAPVTAPIAATVSLATNGTPGFPLLLVAGDVYQVHVQVGSAGGPVFCMNVGIPTRNAAPFATIVDAGAPALSGVALVALVAVLLAAGILVGAQRRRM